MDTRIPFPIYVPFIDDLGAEFLGMGNGEATIALTLEARHMNSWQVTHGGVTMALLVMVMSLAGRSLDPDSRGGVTVEMKTSFLQPGGAPGCRIIAKGKAFHKSITLCFCEGELWVGDKLAAKSSGTFMFSKRLDIAAKLK